MPTRADRTVLTTGANSGLGLATVLELARRGFRSVGSVRSAGKAEIVTEAASRAGVTVETVILDVNDAAACADVVHRVRPWGLINNAGYGGLGAIEDVDDDEARRLMETMVIAPMRLARLAVPGMREAAGGRIINMSSVFGRTTSPLAGWYAGAKHALEALSDSLRVEVASAGIKVILVEPGGFRTDIWNEVADDAIRRPNSPYARAYRRSGAGLRLGQLMLGDPRQVARVVSLALTTPYPLGRYLVGIDAYALTLAQVFTPTALRDLAARIGLGL